MIQCLFDDAATFDEVVHGSLRDGGDLSIVTKENATQGGEPAACLTFTVQTRDGKVDRAQTVVTVRNLIDALHAVMGKYSHLANAKEPDGKIGEQISDHHRGVAYDAVCVEQVWLVSVESVDGFVGMGRTKDDVKAIAEGAINASLG